MSRNRKARGGGPSPVEPEAPSPPARSTWVQTLPLALVFLLVATLALRQVSSLDAGFHLEAGNHILNGQGWPRTDPFTYTVNDHEYVDTSWGYQVVLASAERLAGGPGMVLLHVALVLALFALLLLTIRLVRSDPSTVALLLLLAVLAAEMRYEVRPELLSYTLLALVLYLLHRHAEGLRTPLWALPAIFLIWANSHSLFILGWAAMGCFLTGLAVQRRSVDRRLLGWSVASAVVTLINPYGWKGVVFPFTLGTRLEESNVFAQGIGEFQSPFTLGLSAMLPFYPRVPIVSFRILAVLVVVSLIPLLAKRPWCFLLALPFLWLSFSMVRNLPLLAVVCLPGAVWALPLSEPVRRGWIPVRAGPWLRTGVAAAVALASLVLTLRVYNDAYYIASRRVSRFGLEWNRLAQPLEATAFADGVPLPGRVLNHLNYGGYLMWARSEPVFIDGRLEVIGEEFYEYYSRAFSSAERLEACVRRYGIEWIIFPFKTNHGLLRGLMSDPRWGLVYFDRMAVIFVRRQSFEPRMLHPGVRRVFERGPPPLDLDAVPGLAGPRLGRAGRFFQGLVRRERFPDEPFSEGLFHYFRGDPARAAPLFAEAIRLSDGAYYEIYNNLGSALYRLDRWDEARACYRIVLDDAPANRIARERIAEIDARSGSPARNDAGS